MNSLDICRCEGVRLDQLQAARERYGIDSLRELKLLTRAGMGICQGRVCRPLLAALASAWGLRREAVSLPVRLPLRPVSMERLAAEEASP